MSHTLDHVAIGVPSVANALPLLVGDLGGEGFDGGPGAGFRWIQWRFAGGGVIEILEPEGEPGGFLHRFLDARGPGIHHVTFKVPRLEDAAERARDHGYPIVGWFDEMPFWKECFLHPKQAQGIVVQLAESNPALEPEGLPDWRAWLPADAPAPAEPAAALRALRLSARDEAAARRQWLDTLGGSLARGEDGLLVFTWPGSGFAIEVEIRPDADEGPRWIEVASPRGWPAEGVNALGTRFVASHP